jgi:hypothetical protein
VILLSKSPNNRVQRAVRDKVHGHGRFVATPHQVICARVLNELRPVADAKRWAALRMCLFLAIAVLATTRVSAASDVEYGPTPAKSSFIVKLADEAINADGSEAAENRDLSRAIFTNSFLHGYSTPNGTLPVNSNLYSSRLNGKGWQAGQAYRLRHPDSVAQIMREYGYTPSQASGTWTFGFEAGGFAPDNVQEPPHPDWGQSCWYLSFVFDAAHASDVSKLIPPDQRIGGGTIRIQVKGYLSPRGSFGHFGACPRQFYATSVSAEDK